MLNVILLYRGVLPFAQRKKLWEKYKAKSRKHRSSTVSSNDISYGAHVCMKNSPIYHPGAIGNLLNIILYLKKILNPILYLNFNIIKNIIKKNFKN